MKLGGVVAILAGGLLGAGCGAPGPRPPAVTGRPQSAEDLLAGIRARAASFETARMGMQLSWIDDASGEEESVGLALSYARPGFLRAKATAAAFFTAFELVVGPDEVWLDVPHEGFTVFGQRDDARWNELPLAPDHLLVALLGDPCPAVPCPDDLVMREEGDRFVLVAPEWEMEVDRRTRLPRRYRHDARSGWEIVWSDWAVRRGSPWAHETVIRLTDGVGRARIRLARLRLDPNLPEHLFGFKAPEGREVLSPGEASERWFRLLPPAGS